MLLVAKSGIIYWGSNVTENRSRAYCSFHVQKLFKKALKVVKDPNNS